MVEKDLLRHLAKQFLSKTKEGKLYKKTYDIKARTHAVTSYIIHPLSSKESTDNLRTRLIRVNQKTLFLCSD